MPTKDQGVSIRRINWKEIATIVSGISILSGFITAVVGYIHAEVTVPRILQQTGKQIREEVQAHSSTLHPSSASIREFELLQKSIESSIKDFKDETRSRLDRIKSKIDKQ